MQRIHAKLPLSEIQAPQLKQPDSPDEKPKAVAIQPSSMKASASLESPAASANPQAVSSTGKRDSMVAFGHTESIAPRPKRVTFAPDIVTPQSQTKEVPVAEPNAPGILKGSRSMPDSAQRELTPSRAVPRTNSSLENANRAVSSAPKPTKVSIEKSAQSVVEASSYTEPPPKRRRTETSGVQTKSPPPTDKIRVPNSTREHPSIGTASPTQPVTPIIQECSHIDTQQATTPLPQTVDPSLQSISTSSSSKQTNHSQSSLKTKSTSHNNSVLVSHTDKVSSVHPKSVPPKPPNHHKDAAILTPNATNPAVKQKLQPNDPVPPNNTAKPLVSLINETSEKLVTITRPIEKKRKAASGVIEKTCEEPIKKATENPRENHIEQRIEKVHEKPVPVRSKYEVLLSEAMEMSADRREEELADLHLRMSVIHEANSQARVLRLMASD